MSSKQMNLPAKMDEAIARKYNKIAELVEEGWGEWDRLIRLFSVQEMVLRDRLPWRERNEVIRRLMDLATKDKDEIAPYALSALGMFGAADKLTEDEEDQVKHLSFSLLEAEHEDRCSALSVATSFGVTGRLRETERKTVILAAMEGLAEESRYYSRSVSAALLTAFDFAGTLSPAEKTAVKSALLESAEKSRNVYRNEDTLSSLISLCIRGELTSDEEVQLERIILADAEEYKRTKELTGHAYNTPLFSFLAVLYTTGKMSAEGKTRAVDLVEWAFGNGIVDGDGTVGYDIRAARLAYATPLKGEIPYLIRRSRRRMWSGERYRTANVLRVLLHTGKLNEEEAKEAMSLLYVAATRSDPCIRPLMWIVYAETLSDEGNGDIPVPAWRIPSEVKALLG